MDILFIILLSFIILICIIGTIYTISYNNFQDRIIRINEVEANLDTNLRTKYDHISKIVSIIKNNNDELKSPILDEIVRLRARKINNFDLDRKLIEALTEISTIKEKELPTNEEITKLLNQISEIDEKLETERNYYNKNITEYNKLIKKFPARIVALLCKYTEKTYYDKKNMEDDDEEDFKL